MSFDRIGSAKANSLEGVKVEYFRPERNMKVAIKPGQYYRIVGDSPDSGVAIADRQIEGFIQAEYHFRIGKVSDMENSATCIFPDP